jgi:hypothetical protein
MLSNWDHFGTVTPDTSSWAFWGWLHLWAWIPKWSILAIELLWWVAELFGEERWWSIPIASILLANIWGSDTSTEINSLLILGISWSMSTDVIFCIRCNSNHWVPLASVLLANLGIFETSAQVNSLGVLRISGNVSTGTWSSCWSYWSW